jgi:hypothetical protein
MVSKYSGRMARTKAGSEYLEPTAEPSSFPGMPHGLMMRSALPELGGVQIWTGLVARTRPGWSLSVRPPVNLPAIPGLVAWEGVVETDIWFGPLFTNVRLTRTDQPVHIRAQVPFLQVQPVPQLAYSDEILASFSCPDASELTSSDWERLGQVLLPHPDHEVRQGSYAVTVRKRRSCPVAQTGLLKG